MKVLTMIIKRKRLKSTIRRYLKSTETIFITYCILDHVLKWFKYKFQVKIPH